MAKDKTPLVSLAITTRAKAYSVMSRTGQTRHIADSFTDEECLELASVYDRATDETLATLVADFWGRRAERLAKQKATDTVQPQS